MAESDATRRDSLAGLFPVLRQVRSRARLTQRQIAQATGAGGKHGHKLIARLEAGNVQNPSLKLVLDYLCACKATTHDLTEFLDGYLGSQLPIPSRPRRGPHRKGTEPARGLPPKSEDAATLAMRKEAAWWKLRRTAEEVLHQELTELGLKPMSEERKTAALFGGKVLRSLYRTRSSRPALRERKLKRSQEWATRNGLPEEVRRRLAEAMDSLFAAMEAGGQLELLPPVDEARHLMLLKPSKRFVSDEAMCHNDFVMRQYERFRVQEAARKPVIEAAVNMLRSEGLTKQQLGNYVCFITFFLNVAETTDPKSAARDRRLEEILEGHRAPHRDEAILRRLAELVLTLRDRRN